MCPVLGAASPCRRSWDLAEDQQDAAGHREGWRPAAAETENRSPDSVLGARGWKPARGQEREVCLLVGWEVPDLILLPAKQLAAVLEVGKDFPPAPCFRLVPSSGPGPSPEARFSLGQSSQEQSCPAPGGCWWGFSPPGCPMQAFPQGKAG